MSDDKFYYNEKSQYHRLGGPAIEYKDGAKYWRIDGRMHRLNGPTYMSKTLKYFRWNIDLCISYNPVMDNA